MTIAFASFAIVEHGQVTTSTTTSTMIATSITVMTATVTSTEILPINGSWIYLTGSGICSGPEGNEPCFGAGIGVSPYIFNCLSAAGSPPGCTQQVITTPSSASYVINVRYPFANQTTREINQIAPSTVNCLWTLQGDIPGPQYERYANCISISSSSFILADPAGPFD